MSRSSRSPDRSTIYSTSTGSGRTRRSSFSTWSGASTEGSVTRRISHRDNLGIKVANHILQGPFAQESSHKHGHHHGHHHSKRHSDYDSASSSSSRSHSYTGQHNHHQHGGHHHQHHYSQPQYPAQPRVVSGIAGGGPYGPYGPGPQRFGPQPGQQSFVQLNGPGYPAAGPAPHGARVVSVDPLWDRPEYQPVRHGRHGRGPNIVELVNE
ncbi:hypothetical protein BX600DRAFT_279133 [Xylariales sp. PMI_506]|nr:hypothetical protein BX600DRAFT_279133 [Xylariales sp. PMI_506]